MDLLNMLEDYNVYRQQIKVITGECTKEEYEAIPDQWKKLLNASQAEKVNIVVDMWQAVVKEEMSLTIANIKEHLDDVIIVRFDDKYSLLYVIKRADDHILYYIGGSPVESFPIQDEISESIKNFYTKLHDGFYDYQFKAMGINELRRVDLLYDSTGDELYDEFKKAYIFFSNGMGDYVAFDSITKKGIIWFKGDGAQCGKEFWDVVDEWTNIGLEE